mgnify:FL=1|jgi:hypothetical protein
MEIQNALACATLIMLSGCASERTTNRSEDILSCPPYELVVCRGGTVSRIGSSGRRDPRICSCQPGN